MNHDKSSYWNSYYKKSEKYPAHTPSQFAVFIAGELQKNSFIVDIGCGDGRDSLYFSYLGYPVLGIDASQSAIELCKDKASMHNLSLRFECISVQEKNLFDTISSAITPDQQVVFYARFFLHAITENEEVELFNTLQKISSKKSVICIEFRTFRDALLEKETPDHYRRYLDPLSILNTLISMGFKGDYFVEGFGFAKYKADDAYVARIIASKN